MKPSQIVATTAKKMAPGTKQVVKIAASTNTLVPTGVGMFTLLVSRPDGLDGMAVEGDRSASDLGADDVLLTGSSREIQLSDECGKVAGD